MKHLIRIAALAVALWLPAGPVAADQFEDAAAAYNSGDYATVLRLLKPLADQGDALAQALVGVMYHAGEGVPQDYAAAAKWYRLAAEQGHADAQQNLGLMYHAGEGVPQDYVQAHTWLNLAASSGDKSAIKNRDIVAAKMTPADISKAQKLAKEWRPKTWKELQEPETPKPWWKFWE